MSSPKSISSSRALSISAQAARLRSSLLGMWASSDGDVVGGAEASALFSALTLTLSQGERGFVGSSLLEGTRCQTYLMRSREQHSHGLEGAVEGVPDEAED